MKAQTENQIDDKNGNSTKLTLKCSCCYRTALKLIIMKREIKFRAWDEQYKQFWKVFFIHSMFGSVNYMDMSKDWIPNQFTGLKDKNGKEIYEGDIMKITLEGLGFWKKQKDLERIGEVIYNEDYAGFIVEWEYSKNQHHESLNCDIACTGEVIGNIYENPELLSTPTAVL